MPRMRGLEFCCKDTKDAGSIQKSEKLRRWSYPGDEENRGGS